MKKILPVALLLLCLLAAAAQAAVPENVLSRAVEIIGEQESGHNYGLFITDTNGKVSAGFLQWNAGRASAMVRAVIEKSGSDVSFDGSLSISDKSWAVPLIKSEAGKAVQDALARKDVSAYVEKAMDLGIKDPNALCYYADIAHQVGTGAIVKYHKLAAEKAGGYPSVTLEHLYQAALQYATHTKARRTRVYKLLKENPIQDTAGEGGGAVAGVSLNPSQAQTLTMGETLSLEAVFSPAGASESVRWKSANKKIAQVKGGVVTPVAPGKTSIRVRTASGHTASVQITVRARDAITLEGNSSMRKGETQTLTVSPALTGQSLKWRSGSKKVARVNQSGRVTALRKGKTVIYCKAPDGRVARFSLTVTR